jgi:hypothetical protein
MSFHDLIVNDIPSPVVSQFIHPPPPTTTEGHIGDFLVLAIVDKDGLSIQV